jgi:aerobic C4-dicarboxylate transport protein
MTSTAPSPPRRAPLYKSLFAQVVAGLVLGIALGALAPEFAVGLKFFSDAFLKLISMIVAPIVFCVVVHGIAGAGDLKKVGRVGGKALIYFEVMTTVALAVGLILAYVIRPGVGMNSTPRASTPMRSAPMPRTRTSSRARASAPSSSTSSPRPRSTPSPATTSSRCCSSPSSSA